MSLIKKGRKSCRAIVRALARTWKFIVRLLTRRGELERAIREAMADGRDGRSADLVRSVAKSLARSSQLSDVKTVVFGRKPFSVGAVSAKIVDQKGIRDEDVSRSLMWCLRVSVKTYIILLRSQRTRI